jgi:uncharacterized membrane protein YtjA (UPF0391 family)
MPGITRRTTATWPTTYPIHLIDRSLARAYAEAVSGKGQIMLYWAAVFFIIAVIAGVLGFAGVALAAAGIAKILFYLFLIFFLVALVMGIGRRGSSI